MDELDLAAGCCDRGVGKDDAAAERRRLARRPAAQRAEAGVIAEVHRLRQHFADLGKRRADLRRDLGGGARALLLQRHVDQPVLDGKIPLDREIVVRDHLDDLRGLGAQRFGEA